MLPLGGHQVLFLPSHHHTFESFFFEIVSHLLSSVTLLSEVKIFL